jgi:hypothetical protein
MATTPFDLEQADDESATIRGDLDRMNEVITMNNGPQPNTNSSGLQIFSASGQPQWSDSVGMGWQMAGMGTTWFPGNTVSGTGTGNLASITITGGAADQFAMFEVEAWGNGQMGSTQQALTFTTVLGGNQMATVTFGTTAFSTTPANAIFRWRTVSRVICHTTGASGTWSSYLLATVSVFAANLSPGNANMANGFGCESTGLSTVDSTVGNNFGVSANWAGSATGSQNVTAQVAIAKRWS